MKFQMQQMVYYQDKPWYICGTKIRFGYDLMLEEYSIVKAVYGDYPFNTFGGRTDVKTVDGVREEQLMTADEWRANRRRFLVDELDALQRQIDDRKKELNERAG